MRWRCRPRSSGGGGPANGRSEWHARNMASHGAVSIAARWRKSSARADVTSSHSSISKTHKRCSMTESVPLYASSNPRVSVGVCGSARRIRSASIRSAATPRVLVDSHLSNTRRMHRARGSRTTCQCEPEYTSPIAGRGLPTVRMEWPSALGPVGTLVAVRGLLNKLPFSGILTDHVAISIPC
jgi:hypothetical protein